MKVKVKKLFYIYLVFTMILCLISVFDIHLFGDFSITNQSYISLFQSFPLLADVFSTITNFFGTNQFVYCMMSWLCMILYFIFIIYIPCLIWCWVADIIGGHK